MSNETRESEETEEMTIEDFRHSILDTLTDAISDFLYYRRKEDRVLPVGQIEIAILNGVISISDPTDHFQSELEDSLKIARQNETT